MLGAVEAHLAGRGVQRDDAHALLEAVDAGADFFDDSGQFVAEQRGRNDHAGVIAALVHLEVGAAGQGDLDLDQNLAVTHARDGDFFDLQGLLCRTGRQRSFFRSLLASFRVTADHRG